MNPRHKICCLHERAPVNILVSKVQARHWRMFGNWLFKMPRLLPGGTDCRPVVDGWVLPDLPRTLLSGRVERRPIMAGIVTAEMTRHVWLFLGDLFAKRPELGNDTLTFDNPPSNCVPVSAVSNSASPIHDLRLHVHMTNRPFVVKEITRSRMCGR